MMQFSHRNRIQCRTPCSLYKKRQAINIISTNTENRVLCEKT